MPHALVAGDLAAVLHPEAGMLCSSLRHRGEELLGQRDGVEAYRREGKTMGIPFLHPWANRVSRERFAVLGREVDASRARRDGGGHPIHGLLGPAAWTVQEAGDARLRATFAWRDEAFPFPHDLEQDVALGGSSLTVTTTLRPAGDVAVPVAFGFHPYVAASGDASVVLPVRARQRLGDDGLPLGGFQLAEKFSGRLAERDWDDCFSARDLAAPFVVEDAGRRLEIRMDDGAYPVTQVFAPPGAGFVAIEPMTAPVGALETGEGLRTVAPGDALTASWSVTVAR